MIPNKWGLIRQKDLNLLALSLLQLIDNFSEYEIEIVNNPVGTYPNEIYNAEGTRESRGGFTAFVFDISRYDYVAFPLTGSSYAHTYSGLSATPEGTFGKILHMTQRGIAYEMISVKSEGNTSYAKLSLKNDTIDNCPLLGFIRHRTDNVNPRNLRTIQEVEPEEPAEQKKRK